jgi:hypothetical protein
MPYWLHELVIFSPVQFWQDLEKQWTGCGFGFSDFGLKTKLNRTLKHYSKAYCVGDIFKQKHMGLQGTLCKYEPSKSDADQNSMPLWRTKVFIGFSLVPICAFHVR